MTTRARARVFKYAAAVLLGASLLPAVAEAQGAISSVVVYTDRAQVTRTQAVDCAAGAAHFAGLPSTLDAKTLWATVDGGTVLGVTYKEEATGPRPRADVIQQQIRQLDEQIAVRVADVAAAAAMEQKLSSLRDHTSVIWGRQAAGPKPPIGGWDSALDLLRQQTLAAAKKRRAAQVAQRDLYRKRAELHQDLAAIEQDRRRTTYRVSALLRCAGRRNVHVSYVVPNATWRVSYQARTDPAAGSVTMVAQAVVQQGTGEDWNATSLSVSTANLQRQNTPPDLQRMRVSTYKPAVVRKVLERRFEHREHLKAEGAKDIPGVTTGKTKASGVDAAGEAEPGLAMMLPVAAKATVPSDGREVVVVLDRRSFRAGFALETVPKLFPFVYNRAALRNPFAFPMLPGPVELYRGRAFIGMAETKLRAPNEPFAISLGVTHQVHVSRWVKKEELQGSGILGSKKRLHHRYLIQVGNWSTKPQTIRVLENAPVSQQREINVSLTDDTTTPTSWNKTDGILTWELKMAPRSKREIKLGYTVSLPDSYEVTGY
jgi:uncharacterized protein (TIGR02231 family)